MIKKNIILLNITISFIFIFSFILIKSYRVAEVKREPDILPVIKGKVEIIKIKADKQISNKDEVSSFYNDMEGIDEDISNIKTIKSIEFNENYTEESKSKSKLNNIIMENIDIEKDDVELDQSIENITINSKENEVLKYITTSSKEDFNNTFYKVQLIALKNKQQAELYVSKVKKIYKDLLINLKIYILDVNLEEKGIFYRVRVGDFKNKKDAEKFCEDFFKKNSNFSKSCIVVK